MKRAMLREQVFKLLFRVEFNTPEEMPEQKALFFEDRGVMVNASDRAFIEKQYDAVMERLPEIDRILEESTSGWSISRIAKVELAVLRLAVYEMLWDEAVPVAVAINEAVELSRRFGQDGAAAFVNAVLAKVDKPQKRDGTEQAEKAPTGKKEQGATIVVASRKAGSDRKS